MSLSDIPRRYASAQREPHTAPRLSTYQLFSETGTGESYHYEESAKFNFELEKTIDEAVLIPEFAPYFKNKQADMKRKSRFPAQTAPSERYSALL